MFSIFNHCHPEVSQKATQALYVEYVETYQPERL